MYFLNYANRNILTGTPLLRHCTLFDIDKDISFKGSRSYEIFQYYITYTEKGTGLRVRQSVCINID